MTAISDNAEISRFQLIAWKGCVKLESKGMKHSKGNVTPKIKQYFGLPRSASYADVLARIQQELDKS